MTSKVKNSNRFLKLSQSNILKAELASSGKKSRPLEDSPQIKTVKRQTPVKKANFKYNEEMLAKHSHIISPVGKPPLSTR